MKILTWDTPNFGDRLNELVWPHYLALDDDPSQLLVGIGSLLNHRLPAGPIKWVLGSGIGHGNPPTVDGSWQILWVRGPRSAAALGLPQDRAITDGALLLAELLQPPAGKRYPCAFIPHCSVIDHDAFEELQRVCALAGIHLINPHWPVPQVLESLWQSERVITEALHGAILADAFRIPWLAVTRRGILSFKWQDWSESMDLQYRPARLPYRPQWLSGTHHPRLSRRLAFSLLRPSAKALLARRLQYLSRHGAWQLSRDGVVEQKLGAMKNRLAQLNA